MTLISAGVASVFATSCWFGNLVCKRCLTMSGKTHGPINPFFIAIYQELNARVAQSIEQEIRR